MIKNIGETKLVQQQETNNQLKTKDNKDSDLPTLLCGDVESDWDKKLGLDSLIKIKKFLEENSQEETFRLPVEDWVQSLEKFDLKKWVVSTLKSLFKSPMTPDDLRTVFPSDKVIITPMQKHIVKKNEVYSTLAKQYHVSTTRIINANPGINPNKLQLGQEIIIPESANLDMSKIKTLEDIAEAVDIPREYINDFMEHIEIEGVKNILRTYYDKVKNKDGDEKGTPTIGYGYTGLVRGKPIKDDTEITADEAIKYLALSLFNCKIEAIARLGQDFLEAPKSLQEGIIDNFYNKGWVTGFKEVKNSPTNEIPEDLKKHDYVSATANLNYKTDEVGLKKRMVYRIIYATRDLSSNDRRQVLDRRKAYFDEVIKGLTAKNLPKECELLTKAWKNAYENGKCEGYFD